MMNMQCGQAKRCFPDETTGRMQQYRRIETARVADSHRLTLHGVAGNASRDSPQDRIS